MSLSGFDHTSVGCGAAQDWDHWRTFHLSTDWANAPRHFLGLSGRAVRDLVDFTRHHSHFFVQGSMTERPRSCCWSRSGATRRRPWRRRKRRRGGWKRWTGRGRRKRKWRGSEKRRNSRKGGCLSSGFYSGLQSGLIALEPAAFNLWCCFCIVAFLVSSTPNDGVYY